MVSGEENNEEAPGTESDHDEVELVKETHDEVEFVKETIAVEKEISSKFNPRQEISAKFTLANEVDNVQLFKEIALPPQFLSLSTKYFAATLTTPHEQQHNEEEEGEEASFIKIHLENGDVFEELIFIAACAPHASSKGDVQFMFITRVWFDTLLATTNSLTNSSIIISAESHNEGVCSYIYNIYCD